MIRMDELQPPSAGQLLSGVAEIVHRPLVQVIELALGRAAPDQRRYRFDQQPKVALAWCQIGLCAAMAWYGYGLVSIDYAEGLQTGNGSVAAALRACFAESIVPVGFALMALRFALRIFAPPAHAPMLLHHGEAVGE